MFTAQEFKEIVSEEIRVIRHLATKIDPDRLDWRPTPGQRSTIELMRYLAFCGIGPARAIVDDTWADIAQGMAKHADLTLAGFDQAMAVQERELHALFDAVPESDFAGRGIELPWGPTGALGSMLFSTAVRFLIAYRMQFFLYAKESGASELSTSNAWMGQDMPQETKA